MTDDELITIYRQLNEEHQKNLLELLRRLHILELSACDPQIKNGKQ